MVVLNKYYFLEKLKKIEDGNDELFIKCYIELIKNPNKQKEFEIINHVIIHLPKLRKKVNLLNEKLLSHKQVKRLNELFDKVIHSQNPTKEYKSLFDEIIIEVENFGNLPYFAETNFKTDRMLDVFFFQLFYWFGIGIVLVYLGNMIINIKPSFSDLLFGVLVFLFIILSFIFIYFTNRKLTKFLTYIKTITFIKNGIDFMNKTPPGYNPHSDKIIEKAISELIKTLPTHKNHKLF